MAEDKALGTGGLVINIQADARAAPAPSRDAPRLEELQPASSSAGCLAIQQQQPVHGLEGETRTCLLPQQPTSCSGHQGLTFDNALTKYIGDFGLGQLVVFSLASLMWVPNAVLILLLVFSLGDPIKQRQWTCTSADDTACAAVLASPDPSAGFCSLSPSQWAWVHPKLHLASEFNLVCSESWKAQVANSFFFIGYLIGSGLFGNLADRFGRKKALFGATAAAAATTALCLAATNYWVLLVLRLLTGVGVAGQALSCYVLATEMIGPSWRGSAGILSQVFFIVGEFTLVIFAVTISSWRGQFAAGAVLTAVSLLMWPLLPESGRWLLVQGRKDECNQVLEVIARRNRTTMPPEPLADVAQGPQGAKVGLLGALRDWHIARRFFVLAYAWMVVCMAYYGISFALSGLGGSLLISFSIAAIAELPSYLFAAPMIERWGRHNVMAGGLLLGGAACVGCAFTPAGTGQALLAAAGKFGIAGSFAIASIYTSELFPTLIRSAVLGAENQAARVGGIVAPFIALAGSASHSSLVPFLTFGVAALLAGLLVFTLPETLGVPLPETMQDMGVIASIFTHKSWQHGGIKAATRSMFKRRVVLPAAAKSGLKFKAEATREDDDEDDDDEEERIAAHMI